MKGSYRIRIENRRLVYEFVIRRNITVIRGNSATGKTTLIEMLAAYEHDGASSGISLRCDKACVVLTDTRWEENLRAVSGSIVFIDEDYSFVRSEAFAAAIRHSDNYYVLITRDNLENLPYSVEEIYGIRTSGKYAGLNKTYHEFYRIYMDVPEEEQDREAVIITEDSNSGNDFFTSEAEKEISCVSAGGKSNIYREIVGHPERLHIVIADGAAFGPEMERLRQLVLSGYHIVLYLPESFEWLVLQSGLINGSETRKVLDNPEEYADSRDYFSWEQFFTAFLTEETKGTYLHYSKTALNPVYLQSKEAAAIKTVIPDAVRKYLKGDN